MLGRWRLDDRQASRPRHGAARIADRSIGWPVAAIVAALVLGACGAPDSADDGPVTTLHPDDQAIEDGFYALCNDGNYSDNEEFAKTCSGGEGIDRWLADYGQCDDGSVWSMRSEPDCDRRGGFAGLLPRGYVPEAREGDVALCNDGNFSQNTDFAKTCSGGDGIDRWLAEFGECSDGTVIEMEPSSRCPAGSTFVGLLSNAEAAAATSTTSAPSTSPTTTATGTATATTTSATSAPGTVASSTEVAPVVVDAQAALATLLVADPDPARAPYERADYDGDGWVDVDGDCVNTRHEVLEAASLDPVIFDGCRVAAGRWIDRYSGETITDAALATIDHVIPLAEAHRSGAWRWDVASKVAFANDQTPGMLAVASNDSNQAKADKTPDRWLPPDPAAHCQYAIDWITTKSRYALTVTAAEANALQTALGTCTPTSVIRPSATAPVPTVVITTPTTTTTAPIAPTAGPGAVALTRCNARTEVVEIANTGGEAVSLSGYLLHDEGRKHEVPLGQFGSLQPGQRLAIVSGDDAVDGDGQVVWKRQNVWNNDGDVAHLVTPAGTITTLRC